jgi:hypothetical protein
MPLTHLAAVARRPERPWPERRRFLIPIGLVPFGRPEARWITRQPPSVGYWRVLFLQVTSG